LACPTHDNRAIDTIGENLALSNPETRKTKENAANLAGFNGADDVVEGVYFSVIYITVPRIIATLFCGVAA